MDQGVSRLSAEIIVRRIPVVPGERLQRDQLRSYKIIIDGAERGGDAVLLGDARRTRDSPPDLLVLQPGAEGDREQQRDGDLWLRPRRYGSSDGYHDRQKVLHRPLAPRRRGTLSGPGGRLTASDSAG
jgi:hypothetical protein